MLSRLRWAPLPCLAFLACNPNADGALPQGAGTGGSDLSIPCVVEKVLEQKCWSCHGEDTQFGAPVSLVSYDDLHAPAFGPEYGGAPLFQIAAQKLDDPSKPMPPPSMPQLTPDERALLKEWANQKA
ncbi:MAG: hypothetical protein FJ104_06920, partial [Deltaproteobacteria bacterium]|nr:hypothetical protein [Deltaproteobacteria bacterium]